MTSRKKPPAELTRKDRIDAVLLALPGVDARKINGQRLSQQVCPPAGADNESVLGPQGIAAD